MKLQLKRPLIVFDLETTGISISQDRIVEVFMEKLLPDGSTESKRFLLNPKIPISPTATEMHGYTDADVKDCPTFLDVAHELAAFCKDCDFAGFNSNKFDFPMLVEEFLRVGVDFDVSKRRFIDVQRIFHLMEPRTLSAAYKFYCNKNLEGAHSAKADALATLEVLNAQLEKYSDQLSTDIDTLHALTGQAGLVDLAGRIVLDDKGVEVFNFGKHKGKAVSDVFKKEPSYYDWMINGDFSLDTKRVLTRLRLNMLGTN